MTRSPRRCHMCGGKPRCASCGVALFSTWSLVSLALACAFLGHALGLWMGANL